MQNLYPCAIMALTDGQSGSSCCPNTVDGKRFFVRYAMLVKPHANAVSYTHLDSAWSDQGRIGYQHSEGHRTNAFV